MGVKPPAAPSPPPPRSSSPSSSPSSLSSLPSSSLPRHMYFLEGGLLVTTNLLKPTEWINDTERSHCNVCVQQFMAFRRRHHCRTCGEVVCGGCSARRKVHMIAVNAECATRVCSFCMIRATDASIQLNEQAQRETLQRASVAFSLSSSTLPLPALPSLPSSATDSTSTYCASSRPQTSNDHFLSFPGPRETNVPPFAKQFSLRSLDSDLTTGSVVQLWPNPTVEDEAARLQVAADSHRLTSENDPTMTLLVAIVARTLACPVAFIGISDDDTVHFKATCGWGLTQIPRADCPAALQDRTMVVADTNADKHFHANNLAVDGQPMRYFAGAPIRVLGQCIGAVCALDTAVHTTTLDATRSTLEAVANIVSEVVEQRVGTLDRTHNQKEKENDKEKEKEMDLLDSASVGPGVDDGLSPFSPSKPQPRPPEQLQLQRPAPSRHMMTQSLSSSSGSDLDLAAKRMTPSTTSRETESESEDEDDHWSHPNQQSQGQNERPSVVFPWPRARTSQCGPSSSGAGPRFSLSFPLPVGPPEVGEKIARAMECFQTLRASRWTSTVVEDTVHAFEKDVGGVHFSKSHMTLAGDCTHVIADLQTYDDDYVYADIFASVVRRNKLSVQTWSDLVVLRTSIEGEETPVLSHWRQYPDGSNVIVAFRDDREPMDVGAFLFGWFVAPAAPDENGNSVHVSCIVAEPDHKHNHNQTDEANLSLEMLFRLEQSLPLRYDLTRGRSMRASEVTPMASLSTALQQQAIAENALGLVDVAQHNQEFALQAQMQPSALNENERMMLDLLDKTISTQEVLAAQQHVMANVIDYHGTQLERISSALDRVETILSVNGSKLRDGTLLSDRKSVAL